MNNNCFEKLNIKLSPDHPIYNDCKKFEYKRTVNALGKRNTFPQYWIRDTETYFKDEPILDLIKKYNLIAKVFLVDASYCYTWHKDKFRNWAFNINLSKDPSNLTIFAHEFPDGLQPALSFEEYAYFPTTRLTYESNSAYLLNTQIPHSSINYSDEPRHFLTLGEFVNYEVDSSQKLYVDLDGYNKLVNSLKQNGFID